MPFPVIPVISGVVDVVKGYIGHKKAKTEAKREVELKRIHAEANLDSVSASDMSTSWKDEYLTILFTIPMVVIFYAAVWGDPGTDETPSTIEQVKLAFSEMSALPEWYQFCVYGIVIGTFGLRTLAKFKK